MGTIFTIMAIIIFVTAFSSKNKTKQHEAQRRHEQKMQEDEENACPADARFESEEQVLNNTEEMGQKRADSLARRRAEAERRVRKAEEMAKAKAKVEQTAVAKEAKAEERQTKFEVDPEKMVIYSELMKPKYDEY